MMCLFICYFFATLQKLTTIYITIYGVYGVVKLLGSSPGTALHLWCKVHMVRLLWNTSHIKRPQRLLVKFSSGFSVGGTLDINLVAPVTGYFFKNCRDAYNNQCNKTCPDSHSFTSDKTKSAFSATHWTFTLKVRRNIQSNVILQKCVFPMSLTIWSIHHHPATGLFFCQGLLKPSSLICRCVIHTFWSQISWNQQIRTHRDAEPEHDAVTSLTGINELFAYAVIINFHYITLCDYFLNCLNYASI